MHGACGPVDALYARGFRRTPRCRLPRPCRAARRPARRCDPPLPGAAADALLRGGLQRPVDFVTPV